MKNFQNPVMKMNSQVTDKDLHRKFIQLGNDRRKLTNELLAILPEIFARKIYKKYAATIEEYAGKFGGLSKGVVKKRLRLEKYLENKPLLKDAIKTEGIHKVALVASLATPETETAWVDRLKNMSKPAIQELTKEVRYKLESGKNSKYLNQNQNSNQSLFENSDQIENKNCKTISCFAAPQHIKIDLEGELFFLFLKLKKKYGENLSNQEVMKKVFEENLGRDLHGTIEAMEGKEEKTKEISQTEAKAENQKHPTRQSVKAIPGDSEASLPCTYPVVDSEAPGRRSTSLPSARPAIGKNLPARRYVPASLRKSALQKTDGRCTYPGCNRPAQALHHKNRFAKSKFTENPHESIVPICKIHHEFSHNGIIKNEKSEISEWQLELQPGVLDKIDKLYRQYMHAR